MGDIIVDRPDLEGLGQYEFGWHDSDSAGASAQRGINADVVKDISRRKNEPEWMLERRLKALDLFFKKLMPNWGADLSDIDFDNIENSPQEPDVLMVEEPIQFKEPQKKQQIQA